MRSIFLAISLVLVAMPRVQATQGPCGEGTHVDPTAVIVICNQDQAQSDPTADDAQVSASGVALIYLWLPNCPRALPGRGLIDSQINCQGAHDCSNPGLLAMTLWTARQRAQGDNSHRGWRYIRSECRDPADVGSVKRRTLTWQNVLEAIRRVGVPAAHVNAPGFTLVNLRTTFYTEPRAVSRSLQLVGFDVDVHVTPSSYTWHWGDGSTSTTTTPGRPYPSTDVTHTFEHATRDGPALQVSVDATYTAQYRVDGGPWLRIPDTLTIAGPSTSLPVKQASAVLVADN
jgi:hypothetical protein